MIYREYPYFDLHRKHWNIPTIPKYMCVDKDEFDHFINNYPDVLRKFKVGLGPGYDIMYYDERLFAHTTPWFIAKEWVNDDDNDMCDPKEKYVIMVNYEEIIKE